MVNLLLRLKELYFGLKYFGIVLVPISLMAFVMEYTGVPLRRVVKILPFLVIEPVVILVLLATNPLHGWFYTNPRLEIAQAFIVMAFTPQAGYTLNIVYSLLIGLVSLVLLVRYYRISAASGGAKFWSLCWAASFRSGHYSSPFQAGHPLPALDFTSLRPWSAVCRFWLSAFSNTGCWMWCQKRVIWQSSSWMTVS